ncbi:hypothetical protein BDW22DRAFT_1378501 [Trametopsis cervina]|nr:hypothetical protein BDW22DRAFT_1378501 [Trametopsis cervina]
MASTSSSTPSLTPSRSPTPQPPVQPDHFYNSDSTHSQHSPSSDGRGWLSPEDDPLAQRGIPVFRPTMEEFQDFEGYMNRVECWGNKSGIVKIIPPQEWKDALPSVVPQLNNVKLKNPIEQQMMGRAGLFRQQNIERRKFMSVREWSELCAKEEMRAPGVVDIDLHARSANATARAKPKRGGRRKPRDTETAEPDITPDVVVKDEEEEHEGVSISRVLEDDAPSKSHVSDASPDVNDVPIVVDNPENSVADQSNPDAEGAASLDLSLSKTPGGESSASHTPPADDIKDEEDDEARPKTKGRRAGNTRQAREAALAQRAAKDEVFLESFNPQTHWLPPNTKPEDYTPEFCKELERRYWRHCGLGKPAWYGADMAGSLFTDDTTAWNVAHLPSALSRLLPASDKGLPGVNTPYLYFGMWRATFAWHVEDMDLFSINYIHFGAPKFWYAIPQGRAASLETTMRGYFPKEVSNCSQFLRHKSFLASPTVLSQSSCRPNTLVQHAGEFVVTFPRGYHAGFNLGFNCAESVNFALNSWLDKGRVAKACECVDFSVRIDVDQLLRDREAERINEAAQAALAQPPKRPRKRKSDSTDDPTKPKKAKARVNRAEVVITKQPPTSPPKSQPSSPSKTQAVPPPPKTQPKITLKLPPKPKETDVFPCCLCVSPSRDGLLRVHNPPVWRMEADSGAGASGSGTMMAHEECANIVPETWVDVIDDKSTPVDGAYVGEKVVMGVDAIVKARWNLKCSACTKTRYKAHGAPIQCTKGKCPKAFHVSCARDGASQNIVWNVVREVEKEVILIDDQPQPSTPAPPPPLDTVFSSELDLMVAEPGLMDVEMPQDVSQVTAPVLDTSPEPKVLKRIKKTEVEVLCSQHNPAIAQAKKDAKQDRIRNELLTLPPMTRIKLRVSAGVFEVSLVRVVEETKSVEVIWDRGMKREFKWGSVVFGNTDGVVGQKPTEVAPPPPAIPEGYYTGTLNAQTTTAAYTPAVASTSIAPYVPPASTSAAPYVPPTQYISQPQPAPSTSYQQPQPAASTSYQQPQPLAATSYQQPPGGYPSTSQGQHYRLPYQQPPRYAPYPQAQPAANYYSAPKSWTPYQYAHYPGHATASTSVQPQTAAPNSYYRDINSPRPGATPQAEQRPAYTAMSYQPYGGSTYASGVSSYSQLAQTAHRPHNTSPASSTPPPPSQPPSRPQSVHPAHSMTPSQPPLPVSPPVMQPTPVVPSQSQPAPSRFPTSQGLPQPQPQPPQPPTPPEAMHTLATPQSLVPAQPLTTSQRPIAPKAPTVTTQFHVTTPASYLAQNELRWQVPYTGPSTI